MTPFLKNKVYLIFFSLFIISLIPFALKLKNNNKNQGSSGELYDPSLSYLNTVEKLIGYIDSTYYSSNKSQFDTTQFVSLVSKTTKERFRHGVLNYSASENWVAHLCGKIFWSHMSAIVIPDDILKHDYGLCSQQTIVFMEVLRRKNISVRSVGLGYKEGPGHFLCEVKYNGFWHLYDVSVEPVWSEIENHHLSMDYYLSKKDSLFLAYQSKISRPNFNKLLEKNVYGNINEMPAKNMTLFHKFTFAAIYLIPLILFVLAITSYKRRETTTQPLNFSESLEKSENSMSVVMK